MNELEKYGVVDWIFGNIRNYDKFIFLSVLLGFFLY